MYSKKKILQFMRTQNPLRTFKYTKGKKRRDRKESVQT